MLRNLSAHHNPTRLSFLNEVLSLNAQEFGITNFPTFMTVILNEVLSLNAQESGFVTIR